MKHRSHRVYASPPTPSQTAANFVRGFVATGLLSALQQHGEHRAANKPQVLGRALQGGMAFAAAARTTEALQQGDYLSGVLAVLSGAAGVAIVENILFVNHATKELKQHG